MDKHQHPRAARRVNGIAFAVAAAFAPLHAAHALPTGESLQAGSVIVTRPTATTMQIDQATHKGIVNWTTFSIGASEHVNVTQPSAAAALLNRVVTNSPSEIFGRLTANGQVFLVNNAGVLFAPGASVEVGSLFASSLSITDQNFLNGNYVFSNPGGAGSVINQGSIVTAGGYTALAGPQVRNDGIIAANHGSVALAAGDAVSMDMVGDGLISVRVDQAAFNASVINAGAINADGGTVLLTARSANALLDTVINTTGVLKANALAERNGEIVLDGGSAGSVQVAGQVQAGGAIAISAGGSLEVRGGVHSGGPMTLDADGTVRVIGSGSQSASLTSFASQTIDARALEVTSLDGGFASVTNAGPGAQTISLSNGSGLDVQTVSPGGFAQVSAEGGGGQLIHVVNGDRINVNGAGGAAMVASFGGTQAISITGDGANAITVGAAGSLGPSSIFGGIQTITAGAGGESGSITIVGGNANATFTGVSSGQVFGGTQTVLTSGTLRIAGGDAPNQPPFGFATGLFHNGSGQQTVNAATLEMQGGSSGANNVAIIISSGGAGTIPAGSQAIHVGGEIQLAGGSGGVNNTAIVVSSADQTVTAGGVQLTGGAGGVNNGAFVNIANPGGNQLLNVAGDLSIAGGAGGNAGVNGSPSFQQTIFANNISLTNAAAGGNNSAAFIQGGHQAINAMGDVKLEARASGGALAGVRIGGLAGVAPTGTSLVLNAGGDLILTGGAAPNNTAGIGSTGAIAGLANDITVDVGGSVVLSAGTAPSSGARIGGPPVGTGPGAITIRAGEGIALGGGTAVRTLGAVTLSAGSLANAGVLSNGGGTSNVILNADGFDLAGGSIDAGSAAVILRPRTGTNSFGIEAAGDTTLSNADLASITTSNFVVLGSGMGTTFTGDMTIGETAQVDGGGKHLAFFRSTAPGGTTTIGAQGVSTTGDVIVSAGGGSIVSHGGRMAGDEVQLRAAQGIGAAGAAVNTAANALAMSNGFNGVHVAELDSVELRTVALSVGGIANVLGTSVGGMLDLDVGGSLLVTGQVFSGPMDINAAGALSILAATSSAGLIANGPQTVAAASIDIVAPLPGGVAEIRGNGPGGQTVSAAGHIRLGDHASHGRSSITAGSNQTVNAGTELVLTGGSGPVVDASNATIVLGNPAAVQTVNAGSIRLENSNLGGNNSVAAILAANQAINTTGDVVLQGNASGGALAGVRIGGLGGGAPSATDLTMNVGGNLVLTGGSLAGNGVGLGSTASPNAPGLPNNIHIRAGGDVVLNSGAASSGARIGSAQTGTGPGDISITAGGDIALNGVDEFASIRTLGSVTLNASNISEAAMGRVVAGSLTTVTGGNTHLAGPNEISIFGASAGGDVTLNNTGALDVGSLFASNATLVNAGNTTLSGPWNTLGVTSIAVASDLMVNSFVQSNGPMTLDADGTVRVIGFGSQDASLTSFGGQTINAHALEVTSLDGRFASVTNAGPGAQTISLSDGAGLDVQTLSPAGFAQISSAGNQTITVIDGDHLNVNGAGGNAVVTAFAGAQTITLTGSGANAINVGSAGSVGASQLVAAGQMVNAGSITIVGADAADRTNGFITTGGGAPGRTQTIQATGAITVTGGNAPAQFIAPPPRPPVLTSSNAGIFHNSTGAQTIQAADLVLVGGGSGLSSGALIGSNAGGDQSINVSGVLSLAGGAGGDSNSAVIVGRGNQHILGNPHLTLTGGSGSGSVGGNSAFIIANTVGKTQWIDAVDITVTAGSGGINNSAGITGTRQVITTLGDVVMSGGASTGLFSGTRIGGLGGAQTGPTDLTLDVGGDLLMTGGSTEFNFASIGSTLTLPAPPNRIYISVAGDVVLNPGTAAGARIGSSTGSDEVAPGNITIAAGGNIALNGSSVATPTAIRTLGNVILNAGGTISEGSHGRIEAGSLDTTSAGSTSLTGPNEISFFSATSTAGSVTLNNAGVLDVTGMNAAGDATISNIGDVTVSGPWTVSGTSSITVGSDILIEAPMVSAEVVLVANDGAIFQTPAGSITAGTLSTVSSGETSLLGANDVELFNSTSTGGLTFNNASGTLTLGNIETNGGAFTLSQAGDMTVANVQSFDTVDWDVSGSLRLLGGSAAGSAAEIAADGSINISVGGDLQLAGGSGDGAFARILGYSDINLTVGGFLTLNAGSGQGSWARIQTPTRDQVVTLYFPNLSSGGYFVNGVEGEVRDGFTGFLSGTGAAALGHQLVTIYGEP